MSDYSQVPVETLDSINRYVQYGVPTGSFLRAVLSNNLRMACAQADRFNAAALPQIVNYLHWECPGECWGSPEKVDRWLERFRATKAVAA